MFSESTFRDLHRPWGLAVTDLQVHLFVTGTAQRHQVAFIVRSAFGKGNDVVNFLNRNVPAVLQAFLAEGVLLHVPLTDRPPPAAIALGTVIAARKAVVVLVHLLLMLWAVLLAILAELSASGPAARSFRFHRHRSTSFVHNKSPGGFDPFEALISILFLQVYYSTPAGWTSWDKSGHFGRLSDLNRVFWHNDMA